MAFLAILLAVVLIVTAIRDTQGTLFGALATDVPAFATWAAAIFALAAIGFIPGLKPVSRGLLALVILVIVLKNYNNILSSFEGFAKGPSTSSGSSSGGSSSSGNLLSDVSHGISFLGSASDFLAGGS